MAGTGLAIVMSHTGNEIYKPQRQFFDHRSIIDGTGKHAVHLHRKEDD